MASCRQQWFIILSRTLAPVFKISVSYVKSTVFESETVPRQCLSRLHTPCSGVAVAAFLFLVKQAPEDEFSSFTHFRKEHEIIILVLAYDQGVFYGRAIPGHVFRISLRLLLYCPT